jgi:hypothetical protein
MGWINANAIFHYYLKIRMIKKGLSENYVSEIFKVGIRQLQMNIVSYQMFLNIKAKFTRSSKKLNEQVNIFSKEGILIIFY